MPLPFEYESVISIPQFSDCPSNPKNQRNSDFLYRKTVSVVDK